MNLLLDTCTLLWFLEDNPRLRHHINHLIAQADSVTVSVASIWEISIKSSQGKLRLPTYYMEIMRTKGFKELPVNMTHALRVASLPPIHKDPFDRLLIAQALCESLTIVTQDAHIALYPVKTLQA
jgi:PIN domain nuclease of toxin-antitoxin system